MHTRINYLKYLPAAISGMLLTAGFPDTNAFALAFVALAPLIISLDRMTAKESFWAGIVTGIAHYSTLIYWIVPTLCVYGGLHPLFSIATLALLCLYLALFTGLFAFLIKKLDPGPVFSPLLGACLWVGLEYVRAHALTGFPWGILGYSQYSNLLLVQIADLTGVLGISFLIVLCNYLAAFIFLYFKTGRDRENVFITKKQLATCICYILIPLVAAMIYGKVRIQDIDKTILSASHTRLAIVQGNIEQDKKWSQEFKHHTIEKYGNLSLKASESRPDLIVWPETALPFYYGRDLVHSNRVDEFVRRSKSCFLIGSPAAETGKESTLYFNRAYMVNQLSLVTGHYDKTHLVPFGEYVPLGKYLTFLGKLTQQAGNFSCGKKEYIPLIFGDHSTGVLICFEILFPGISREFVRNGADILITITNDAWFGKTSAARQHFSIAVLRAVENRRSVARAANTGISGFIDPSGKILDQTPLFAEAMMSMEVPALQEISFYTRHPDLISMAALVVICMTFMIKVMNIIFRRIKK